ncbi:FHA domain-containing protein, partial [mine drainage metagenome]
MGLQQFEQRLERLVEGAFAKAFRGELQPVELGRRLTREMDLQRAISVRGLV